MGPDEPSIELRPPRVRAASDMNDGLESGFSDDDPAATMRVLYTPDAIASKLAHRWRGLSTLEVGAGDDGLMAELVSNDETARPITPAGSPDRRSHRPNLSLVVSSPGSDKVPVVRLGRARPLSIAAPMVRAPATLVYQSHAAARCHGRLPPTGCLASGSHPSHPPTRWAPFSPNAPSLTLRIWPLASRRTRRHVLAHNRDPVQDLSQDPVRVRPPCSCAHGPGLPHGPGLA